MLNVLEDCLITLEKGTQCKRPQSGRNRRKSRSISTLKELRMTIDDLKARPALKFMMQFVQFNVTAVNFHSRLDGQSKI